MKPQSILDSFTVSPSQTTASHTLTTDGHTLLPFARRNQCLKFLQFDMDGNCTTRVNTRQDILAEIRKSSLPVSNPKQRIPKRKPSFRVHDLNYRHAQEPWQPRHTRGRGAPRPRPSMYTAMQTAHSHTDRCNGNRLSVRDMRQIDPAFTAKPAIWVREDAMVVSLESVRAIVLHDRMFVFDPDNEKVRMPIRYIKKRLLNEVEDIFLPFEFRALEGILIYTCTVLEKEFSMIEPGLRNTLFDLPNRIDSEKLEKLRHLEQRLNHYYSRARKVQAVLQSVLDEDEDMADMYLTEKRRNPDATRNPIDHDEAEMLLETYLQNVDDLTSKAGLLNTAIDDTENLVEIHLDTMQNRLLLVDLIITVIVTLLSFATMVTALFGMNIPLPVGMSQLPTSQYYFYGWVALMLLVMTVGLVVLVRWFRRQGIYQGRIHKTARRLREGQPAAAVRASEETRQQTEAILSKKQGLRSFRRFNSGISRPPWTD